jgi:hypothetical protein
MSKVESSEHLLKSNTNGNENNTSDDAEPIPAEIVITKAKILRKKGKLYDMFISFKTLNIAFDHMKKLYCDERCDKYCIFCNPWRYNNVTTTAMGDKYRYDCNHKGCKKTIVLTHFPSQITQLDISRDNHNHLTCLKNENGMKLCIKGVPEASKNVYKN